MDQAQGAAIHHQLDALVKSLEPLDQAASEADDHDVRALLARLYEARQAALKIACRRSLLVAPQGVRLTKL